MIRMNFGVTFVLLVLSAVICSASGPKNTAQEDMELKAIVFPTDVPEPVEVEEDFVELPEWMDVNLDKLSLEKLSLLNNVSNLTELAALFGLTKEQQDKLDKESQMKVEDELNRSEVGLRVGTVGGNEIPHDAVFASCKPELKVIELEAPPSTLYLPQCVRLQRCGGCCTSSLLSCQPTKSEPVKCKVMKLDSSLKRRRTRRGTRARYTIVNQVNHVDCSCQCSIKEHNCDKNIEDYKVSECACVCKNRDEEPKCIKKSTHYWDHRICSCRCKRTQQDCSTGEDFNQDTCSCVRRVIFGL